MVDTDFDVETLQQVGNIIMCTGCREEENLELCEECESRNLDGTCACTHCPECKKTKQCYSCATRGGWTPLSALQELERERTP